MTNGSRMRRVGFTMVELLLVIGVLVVLSGVGVVAYTRLKESADKKSTKLLLGNVAEALEAYRAAVNKYPADEEGLSALITAPDDEAEAKLWRDGGGPFLKDGRIPKDPWNQEVKYNTREQVEGVAGPPFIVYSFGPDGQEDTEDDIKSYEEEAL